MKNYRWYLFLISGLILFSLASYLSMIFLFKRPEDTIYYFFQDLSFVPINVLLVALILDKLMQKKEKEALFIKLNMVIGLFFSEMGNQILSMILNICPSPELVCNNLQIHKDWDLKRYNEKIKKFQSFDYKVDASVTDLNYFKKFLIDKKEFLLQLMENPNLLEHDSFTDLLLALFHLREELFQRKEFSKLPDSDIEHLKGDIKRVYKTIVIEWLQYMKHLKKEYPYLYSLAVRTNPFNLQSSVVINES